MHCVQLYSLPIHLVQLQWPDNYLGLRTAVLFPSRSIEGVFSITCTAVVLLYALHRLHFPVCVYDSTREGELIR